MSKKTLFWFRRDLRLHDNTGLFKALSEEKNVLPVFILDTNILEKLEKCDARVTFLHQTLKGLKQKLQQHGSDLHIEYGEPKAVWKKLVNTHQPTAVYANTDYEPYARTRDAWVEKFLAEQDITFVRTKDHIVFEKNEVLKADGTPYTVFTPYSRKWREHLTPADLAPFKSEDLPQNYAQISKKTDTPSLESMGFSQSSLTLPGQDIDLKIIKNYDQTRDIPSLNTGTSHLGLHLRFGTISIRNLVHQSLPLNDTYVSELCWRDFYQQILWHFPHAADKPFRAKYEAIEWRNMEGEFEKWCNGQTGYPIVDAGMRELNATGYMHNRVRMITASFLCKHLLIDWRWGEAYFAKKLLDFDLAANNGGWQWSAGTGCDAAPYFRVFNPEAQQKKFDPKFEYIKKWVPEFGTDAYVQPMVEHKIARIRALDTYKQGLGN